METPTVLNLEVQVDEQWGRPRKEPKWWLRRALATEGGGSPRSAAERRTPPPYNPPEAVATCWRRASIRRVPA